MKAGIEDVLLDSFLCVDVLEYFSTVLPIPTYVTAL
jgi:hypothetical protein